jgi:hypothetical protein
METTAIPFSTHFVWQSHQTLGSVRLQFLWNAFEAKTVGEEVAKKVAMELVMINSVVEQELLPLKKQPKGK